MHYLTLEQILLIHSMMIDETGGLHGIRDREALLSIHKAPEQAAFGQELYRTVFDKAAVYVREIIMRHPFLDGNKRTGMTAGAIFLEENGFVFVAKRGEIEKFALELVQDHLAIPMIAAWLKRHSRKASRGV